MSKMYSQLLEELSELADPKRAKSSTWFFKTGPGDYGEGDIFMGVTNPQLRKLSRAYKSLDLESIKKLLFDPVHEKRLIALFIMVLQFQKGDESLRKEIYDLYMSNTAQVNNWDLVDCSAEHIVGPFLVDNPKQMQILTNLAESDLLWDRRIAMLATFHYIKNKQHQEAFVIAEKLLHDSQDLIHKAVGWMLREVGQRSGREVEEIFLKKYYKTMPRTMLRYSIEKFEEPLRQKYLKGLI